MIKIMTVLAVAAAVTLGGCHVFKQKSVATGAVATVKQAAPIPAVTLENLDVRVADIEHRMAAARAARAAAVAKSFR